MFSSQLSRGFRSAVSQTIRGVHTKAAVLGAAGGIGQPLSLLMKLDKNIDELSLYDVAPVIPGVAADLRHINSSTQITEGYKADEIEHALKGCNLVVIPAGIPRKPGMTRDDLFGINAGIVKTLAESCAKHCPEAMFLIISNPVNSTVPIFAEVLKKHGAYNKKHLFGVTTLDITRANTFVAAHMEQAVDKTKVDVIGGHAGTTILPLLSQVKGATYSEEQLKALTHRIQFGGDEVVKAKDGAGSATLSMAYAGAEFASLVARALKGEKGLRACSFVENDLTDAKYFSTPITLGTDGCEEVHSYGTLSPFEQEVFDSMLPDLKKQIEKGENFVASKA